MIINVNGQKDSLYYCNAYPSDKQDNSMDEKAKVKNGSVFVGDMKGTFEDNIFQRKLESQRKAIKTILNQFADDMKVTDQIQSCKDQKEFLQSEADDTLEKINEILGIQEELADTYGVTADSDEMKNLEILRKSMSRPDELTDEEQQQLANMGPLTDFQKESLALDATKNIYQERLDSLNQGVIGQNCALIGIKLAECKNDGMVSAQREASEIMEQASKTVINQLIQEAKDKQDDKISEVKESQEEKAKEEDEKEQQTEKTSDAVQPTASDNSMEASQIPNKVAEAQNEVQSMMAKKLILEEDTKGLVVDETV